MALKLSLAVRNAIMDAIDSTIGTTPHLFFYGGSVPADCAASDTGSPLADITLPSGSPGWWGPDPATAGAKSLLGSWTVAASGTGTITHWRLKQGATTHMQGTADVSGANPTPDMVISARNVTTNQNVTVTTFTATAPGA